LGSNKKKRTVSPNSNVSSDKKQKVHEIDDHQDDENVVLPQIKTDEVEEK